jgi:tetratricopeptide (TPR) repeat protein
MTSRFDPKVILDVPFIGWEEINRVGLEINPSQPASLGMVLAYWGMDPEGVLQQRLGDENDALRDWATEMREHGSIDDLKAMLADGIPVVVGPTALTPFAHPTNSIPYELGITEVPEQYQVTSGNLDGVFVPLDSPGLANARLDDHGKIGEDFWYCARVVVGYDERTSSLYLHDPTFGPCWKVDFDSFDCMWEAGGRCYLGLTPPDYRDRVPPFATNVHQRTPDHDATVRYVYGYALSSLGRTEDAERQLRQGLGLDDTGIGYRYLLLLELAVVRVKRGDLEDATALAKEAVRLVPRHNCGWYLLANIYRRQGVIGFMRCTHALWKAKSLQNTLSDRAALPRNLFLAEGV